MAETFIGQPWRIPYTAKQLQDAAEHQVPIVGSNGNWWRWDIDTSDWVDTGVAVATSLADASVTWQKLAPEARKSNPNLLDNWYFVGGGSQQGGGQFPINQRGETEYSGVAGYTIDRWKSRNAHMMVRITSDCVEFEQMTDGWQPGISQPIEDFSLLVGRELTFTVLARGDGTNAPKIASMENGRTIVSGTPSTDWQLISLTYTPASSNDIPRIYASANDTVHPVIGLKAAKLELGLNQTLAHEAGGWNLIDPAPNFSDELMRCQRYQQVLSAGWIGWGIMDSNTYGQFALPINVPMRVVPAISGDLAIFNSKNNLLVNNGRVNLMSKNAVNGAFSIPAETDLSKGDYIVMHTFSTVILDANL